MSDYISNKIKELEDIIISMEDYYPGGLDCMSEIYYAQASSFLQCAVQALSMAELQQTRAIAQQQIGGIL